MDNTRKIFLAKGRQLAFALYGDPAGVPLLLLHGSPGSRLWFLEDDAAAAQLGVRLVALDRPGYGESDPHPGRSLLGYAQDVAAVADALGFGRFAVLGVSGGGPHAAACARALADRVAVAILVSSPAPPELAGSLRGIAWGNRLGFSLARWAPGLLRRLAAASARRFANDVSRGVDELATSLCASDQRVLEDARKRKEIARHFQEGYRAGIGGHVQDAGLVAGPWGFSLNEISVPVQVWHGRADTLVPVQMAQALAREIPRSEAHIIEDAGHLLLDAPEHWAAVLQSLQQYRSALAC